RRLFRWQPRFRLRRENKGRCKTTVARDLRARGSRPDRAGRSRFRMAAEPVARRATNNPEGIESLSPGLARQRLPWVTNKEEPNPEGVEAASRTSLQPFRVGRLLDLNPGLMLRINPGLSDSTPVGVARRATATAFGSRET